MPNPKPALIATTELDNEAAKDVKVEQGRKVTYVFNITTYDNLKIPYAVSINGKVQDEFKSKTKRMPINGTIIVSNVKPGASVSLFLNSDAHPLYRKEPVYTVTPLVHDVVVNILEKKGKHRDEAVPLQSKNNGGNSISAQEVQTYTSVLTGDIWLKVSHKYTSDEVNSLLPPETTPEIKAAVLRIYNGLTQPKLTIALSAKLGKEEKTISVKFEDGENPHENIASGYDLLKEGLTRVHRAGYAAIFSAAVEAEVFSITMSSAWRPMLGSIAHRAGLGLDVTYLGATKLNRQSLSNPTARQNDNVSNAEKELFSAVKLAKAQQLSAAKNLTGAKLELKAASGDSQQLPIARAKLKKTEELHASAELARKEAELAWNTERDKNEPEVVRKFRAALIRSQSIAQIFDPWFIDFNVKDKVSASPNMQGDKNEKTHAHHLHITVRDANII